MKNLIWLLLLPFSAFAIQTPDLHHIRAWYQRAAAVKHDAAQLNKLLLQVDSNALPVIVCYKGANEMIQAKYTLNPLAKLNRFNRGKELIQKAFSRDTLNLEIRFIRYAIQSNLPAFLGYHEELNKDKRFLLDNTKASQDPELQEMIFNYLSGLTVIKPEELKQLKN
jgi:hypothetical protein